MGKIYHRAGGKVWRRWVRRNWHYDGNTGEVMWRDKWKRENANHPMPETADGLHLRTPWGRVLTWKIAYTLKLNRFPKGRGIFRDGNEHNTSWRNIKPLAKGEKKPTCTVISRKIRGRQRDAHSEYCREPWARGVTRVIETTDSTSLARKNGGELPRKRYALTYEEKTIATCDSYYGIKDLQRMLEAQISWYDSMSCPRTWPAFDNDRAFVELAEKHEAKQGEP